MVRDGSVFPPPNEPPDLEISGGAYFFSSLETHRYQIQRHARKLGARAFAVRPRLLSPSPKVLTHHSPALVPLGTPISVPVRSSGHPRRVPLPHPTATGRFAHRRRALAGHLFGRLGRWRRHHLASRPPQGSGSTASGWSDSHQPLGRPRSCSSHLCDTCEGLTSWYQAHSFPSVSSDDSGDYIPSAGFHYRPGLAWPPAKGQGVLVELAKGEGEVLLDEQIQVRRSPLLH